MPDEKSHFQIWTCDILTSQEKSQAFQSAQSVPSSAMGTRFSKVEVPPSETDASPESQASPSLKPHLLSLPHEIRLLIYDQIFASLPDMHDAAKAKDLEPNLFRICRSIRSEANSHYDTWIRARSNELLREDA